MRFCIVDSEDSPKWIGGDRLFSEPMGEPGDEFVVLRPALDGASSLDGIDIDQFDGFIFPGSRHSVNDGNAWHEAVEGLIRQLYDAGQREVREGGAAGYTAPRVLGVCYGSQAIARALGGEVGPNESGLFAFGAVELEPTAALLARPELNGLDGEPMAPAPLLTDAAAHSAGAAGEAAPDGSAARRKSYQVPGMSAAALAEAAAALPPGLEIPTAVPDPDSAPWSPGSPVVLLQSHGECVRRLPAGAQLLASSADAPADMWSLPPNVLCVQAHPEFDNRPMARSILPALLGRMVAEEESQRGSDTAAATGAVLERARADLARPRHGQLVMTMFKRFLRRMPA